MPARQYRGREIFDVMNIDLTKVTDLEFEGIDHGDYPDYCDAYVSAAYYNGGPMTDEQLDYLNEYHRDFVQEEIYDHIF
jgi:hypothetical protein